MPLRGPWFIGFGLFLIACGVAGFLSNPSAAKTALLSGGTFGTLCILCGVLMRRGIGAAGFAAWAITLLLCAAFAWRATVGWLAVANGEPKLFAASLISLMLCGAIASLVVLVRTRGPN
jgi:uncharacterized membrane protein (UPF0136 family)